MKIIKSTKSLIGIIGLLLLSSNVLAASVPVVSFQISDNDIQINEAFTVDVLVSGIDPFDEVIGFGFDLNLDPNWSLGPVSIGPSFDYDDSAFFPDIDVAGSVDFFNFGPSGDNILLASVQLSGSSAGTFDFGISSDLFDPFEGLQLFSSLNPFDITYSEQVTINSAATGQVPEPGILWLLSFGLGAYFASKKTFFR